MRNLPRPALPTAQLEIDGVLVDYRSLSRAQALALNDYQGRPNDGEDWIVACGLEISVEEAHAWRDAVTTKVAGELLEAIIEISGLSVADVRQALKADEDDEAEDEADAPKA